MTTILVVDDLLADRRIAGGLLEKSGEFKVVYAENGAAALEQIEAHIPDLVVTDLQMPEMDGLELVKAVRDKYIMIPTILMTAAGSEQIAVQALEYGAASYVPKKHLSRELFNTCSRVLSASSSQRGIKRLLNRISEMKFSLENDLGLISSLVAHLRELTQERRIFDESDCLRIGTALDEALLNSYYHGNLEVDSELKESDHNEFHNLANQRLAKEPYKSRKIHVTVRILDEQVEFIIQDEGHGFDPSSLPDPTDLEYLERPSGRGLLLMRAFMDSVEYNETGNSVVMIKSRGSNSVLDDD